MSTMLRVPESIEQQLAHVGSCRLSVADGTCPLAGQVERLLSAQERRLLALAPRSSGKPKAATPRPKRRQKAVAPAAKHRQADPAPVPSVPAKPAKPEALGLHRAPAGAYDDAVVRAVTAAPGLTLTALAKRQGVAVGTMHSVLKRLMSTKRIVHENGGYHPVISQATA